jgi:hypothetical protein
MENEDTTQFQFLAERTQFLRWRKLFGREFAHSLLAVVVHKPERLVFAPRFDHLTRSRRAWLVEEGLMNRGSHDLDEPRRAYWHR